MTQKELDQAANEYDESLTYSSVSEQYDVKKAFVTGAKWIINSVWHEMSEEPKHGGMIALYGNGKATVFVWNGDMKWKDIDKFFRAEKWAYMDDLLPIKEG